MTIEYKDSKRIITSPASASYWDFDGTNDYVQMPTIPTGYTFAVSMWVRKDASGRMAFMVDNDTNGIWLEDADISNVRLRVGHSQSGSDFDTNTTFPVDGNFHHLVFNVGTPNQIWLDGVSLGTGGTANSTSTNWIPSMGARKSSSTTDRFLNGAMSKVGIWDRKLTDAEVASLYAEAEPSSISSGLLATYDFEQTGSTLEDQTNSYDGTNNGATAGGTRDVPETKPTDVQDNSILVEKDISRRYWFSKAPVATDDYTSNKGYVDNTSDWAVPASGKIDFETVRRSTTSQEMYIDLQDSDYLGENLSDTNWTVKFGKFKVVNEATSSGNVLLHICLSNTNGSSGGTQQTHSCQVNFSQSEGGYTNYCTTGNLHGSGASQQNVTGTAGMADGDERYIEMSRSGDDFTVKICSDANYSTVLGSGTQTKTGISGLRYLKFVNDSEQNASLTASAELSGGLEIINGTDTWNMQPTYDTNFTSTSGWLTDGTDINIDTSVNAIISDNNNGSTTHQGISKDLGSDLHATKWVIDLDIYCTNVTNSNSNWTHIGMSNYNASRDDDEAQNFMGINVLAEYTQISTGNGNYLGLMSNSNTTLGNFTPVGVSGDGDEVATGAQFYLRLIRDGATTLKLERHSTSARTGSTLTTTHSCNNLSGLRYFVISHRSRTHSGRQNLKIENVRFYNGVTSIN